VARGRPRKKPDRREYTNEFHHIPPTSPEELRWNLDRLMEQYGGRYPGIYRDLRSAREDLDRRINEGYT